jgi:mono/diheme cytochrome c family protein
MRATAVLAAVAVAWGAATAAADPAYNYLLRCIGCHTSAGVSPPLGRIPPLQGVVGHFAKVPEGRRYLVNVPGIVSAQLSPAETASLLNWVIETYGGPSLPEDYRPFTAEEVVALRLEAPDNVMALRESVRGLLRERGYDIGAYP